jgi:hypothetical protein
MRSLILVMLVIAAFALTSCGEKADTISETQDAEATQVAAGGSGCKGACEGGACKIEGDAASAEPCVCKCPCGCEFNCKCSTESCDGGCTVELACGCKCMCECVKADDGTCACKCSFECAPDCATDCKCGKS